MVNSGVVAAIHVSGLRCDPCGAVRWTVDSPTHCTARVTTHTCYMYCYHNAGVDHRDFKFSVLNFKNS